MMHVNCLPEYFFSSFYHILLVFHWDGVNRDPWTMSLCRRYHCTKNCASKYNACAPTDWWKKAHLFIEISKISRGSPVTQILVTYFPKKLPKNYPKFWPISHQKSPISHHFPANFCKISRAARQKKSKIFPPPKIAKFTPKKFKFSYKIGQIS